MARKKKEETPVKETKDVKPKIKIPEGMTYAEFMLQRLKQQENIKTDFKYDSKTESIAKEMDTFLQKETNVKVETLSERNSVPYWLDTNCIALNWIITNDFNRGFPGCKAIMISGESSKGKSLLTDVILGENIKNQGVSYKFDIEDAGTSEFTSKIVGSKDVASKIRIIGPKDLTDKTAVKDQVITIEKLQKVLNRIIDFQVSKGKERSKSVVAVIDSVTQLTSEKEVDSVVNNKDVADMTSAREMRKMFRTITQKQRDANLTVIGIAQLTANIGVMMGPTKTENAKGSGFKYASSLSLQLTSDREITKEVNGGAPIPIGIKMRMKTTKNRVEFKGRDAWLYFYFNRGIDKFGGLLELLAQFGVMKASAKASVLGEYSETCTFVWVHPDTDEEFKFKIPTFSKTMEKMDEKKRSELLNIWNIQINAIYKDMTNGIDESELLDSDDPEDEEEMLQDQDLVEE